MSPEEILIEVASEDPSRPLKIGIEEAASLILDAKKEKEPFLWQPTPPEET